jgi:hypothetical protein
MHIHDFIPLQDMCETGLLFNIVLGNLECKSQRADFGTNLV